MTNARCCRTSPPDYDLIAEKAKTATVVHIQRSRGYTQRNAFDLATIQKVADIARKANPQRSHLCGQLLW